ncbi:hypothetical protein B0H14DRAFT_2913871 [Mycena olivaceomarginata]|nr:hypothetical protein B0H14DRAFT_2913871 [Mycena olivaceomarginata]
MDPVHETDGLRHQYAWKHSLQTVPIASRRPSEDTVTLSRVKSWLPAKNLAAVPITPAGDRISVDLTVFQANVLLAADFSTFHLSILQSNNLSQDKLDPRISEERHIFSH